MGKKSLKFGDPESIKLRDKSKRRPLRGKVAKKDIKRICAFDKCKKEFTWREKGKYNQHFCSLTCANEFAALFGGGGRPTEWRPEFNQKMIDYFNVPAYTDVIDTTTFKDDKKISEKFKRVPSDLPLFEGFAAEIKVSPARLCEWEQEKDVSKYPGFREAHAICKAIQHRILVVGTLNGLYNSGFAQFLAKNITELKDKQEHEHGGIGGGPIEYNVIL